MGKIYRGARLGDSTADPVRVHVSDEGKHYPLEHRKLHSPTGMNWGYGGSGPADLARSILFDLFGKLGEQPVFYQAFKAHFVGAMPDRWELKEETIRAWTETTEAGRRAIADGRQQLEAFSVPLEDPADGLEKGSAEMAFILIIVGLLAGFVWVFSLIPKG